MENTSFKNTRLAIKDSNSDNNLTEKDDKSNRSKS